MKPTLPKGVLFDLDDTLIAYDAVADDSWRRVCEQFSDDAAQAISLLNAVSQRRSWYWSDPDRHHRGRHNLESARQEIVRAALESIGNGNHQLADEIAQAYSVTRDLSIHLLPGAIDTLEFFNRNGIPLVLVTNGTKDRQRAKIERFHLASYFKGILIEGEQGVGKPDLAVYKRALSSLNEEARDVWSVGDNLEWDVYAPMRVGMQGIWHNYSGTTLPGTQQSPDRIIAAVAELIAT